MLDQKKFRKDFENTCKTIEIMENDIKNLNNSLIKKHRKFQDGDVVLVKTTYNGTKKLYVKNCYIKELGDNGEFSILDYTLTSNKDLTYEVFYNIEDIKLYTSKDIKVYSEDDIISGTILTIKDFNSNGKETKTTMSRILSSSYGINDELDVHLEHINKSTFFIKMKKLILFLNSNKVNNGINGYRVYSISDDNTDYTKLHKISFNIKNKL